MIRDLHYEVVEGEGPDPGYGERRAAASVSPFDSLGGTQGSPRAVLRPDGNVGLVGVERDLGLEALARGGSQGLQPVGSGAGEDLPGGDLRRPVPTNVERYAAFGRFLGPDFCDDGRPVLRAADPPGTECPVGLDGLWEAGLEEKHSVAGMLGEEGGAAPTDEHVPVREVLHVDLVGRERVLWEGILGGQLGCHSLLFDNRGSSMSAPLLSKRVMVPSFWRRASCWKAKRAPSPIAKSLLFPPRRQITSPLSRSTL